MRYVILLAVMLCPFASAGEVYKCKGPNGDVTFTNIKCPEHTAIEHYATYQPEEEPPPPAPAEPSTAPGPAASAQPPAAAPVDQPAARAPDPPPAQVLQPSAPAIAPEAVATPLQQPVRAGVQEPAQAEPAMPPPPTTLASGYKCSDKSSTWLQSTPCPPRSAHVAPGTIERPTGEMTPVVAPTQAKPVEPLQEAGSSQGPLCDQLISQAAGHDQGGTGTDELNKLLAANGCRR